MNNFNKINMLRIFALSFLLFSCTNTSTTAKDKGQIWEEAKESTEEVSNDVVVKLPAFNKLAKRLNPPVVYISTTQIRKGMNPFHFFGTPKKKSPHNKQSPFDDFFGDDFLHKFFGKQPEQREQKVHGLGSGFIISKDGYIVTNNHVVEMATKIMVKITDHEEEYEAETVGTDKLSDLALIKIKTKKDLPFVVLGDSDKLEVGEWVLAIGNPFGLSHTVTAGIVSYIGRKKELRSISAGYNEFIQTDASINPGNSGGPLFNINGDVIGINVAIVAGASGIGFAIPINTAKNVLTQLKEKGKVVRGWLGVKIQPVDENVMKAFDLKDKNGTLIAEVFEDTPAAKAGIKAGDIVRKYDGKNIKDYDELQKFVAQTDVDKEVNVELLRDGKKKILKVKIVERTHEETLIAKDDKTTKEDILGLSVANITPEVARNYELKVEEKGVVITDVGEKSPAKGLARGHVIKKINKSSILNVDDYKKAVKKLKKGDSVAMLIKTRTGGTVFISFVIEE